MELKKPHPIRLVGRVETWKGLVPYSHAADKDWEESLATEDPSPKPGLPAHSSSTRKIGPHDFWL